MIYTFEPYTLDLGLHELRCAGTPIGLEPLAFRVLTYLVHHRDQAVSKAQLLAHLWTESFLSDAVLVQSVVKVRRALGDTGQTQRYIKTITGHGYRFIAPVQASESLGEAAQAQATTRSWPEAPPTWWDDAYPVAARGQALAILSEVLRRCEGRQGTVAVLVLRLDGAPPERAPHETPAVAITFARQPSH